MFLPPLPLLPGRNVVAAMLCLLLSALLQFPWGLAGMFGITGALSHLCARLVSVEESILKVREENSVKYQRTFLGSEMIDWLIQEGEVENRQEAVELGRALLEHGIIQHGEPGSGWRARDERGCARNKSPFMPCNKCWSSAHLEMAMEPFSSMFGAGDL